MAWHAGYGYCASHSRWFRGFQLFLIGRGHADHHLGPGRPQARRREVTQALLEHDPYLVRA